MQYNNHLLVAKAQEIKNNNNHVHRIFVCFFLYYQVVKRVLDCERTLARIRK